MSLFQRGGGRKLACLGWPIALLLGSGSGAFAHAGGDQALKDERPHLLRTAQDLGHGAFINKQARTEADFDKNALMDAFQKRIPVHLDFFTLGASDHNLVSIYMSKDGVLFTREASPVFKGLNSHKAPVYGLLWVSDKEKAIFYVPSSQMSTGQNLDYALKLQATEEAAHHEAYPVFQLDTAGGEDIPQGALADKVISQASVPIRNPYAESADVVARLNKRLNHAVHDCGLDERGDKKPAWLCSGLIMRSTSHLSPWASASVAAHYFVRADTRTRHLMSGAGRGLILKPTADLGENWLKCIYPRDANSAWGEGGNYHRDHANFLCSDAATQMSQADLSSCSRVLGIRAGASAAQWTAAFLAKYPYRRNGEEALRQCSLSVHDASQFEAAIQVSATNLKASDDPWNELIVKPWQAADIPEIEAFFWSANSEGLFYDDDFLKAKEMAKKYVAPDGKPVPVVKVNLHANVVSLP
ncbi:hypothetical protein J9978_08865 [Chromobacterium violaceum]|uniref:hypothetical protein n=1 Tax=Chromobacterium violaceum TaxID=536 RepID=UPI0009DB3ABA|nr:hypothetical protein [Chromobacterium violaceum]MBP4049609.1 hypothetical protein [Chromobacterium violaceum]OQS28712.1 hypothetical protein B0T41_04855 [Chromobacterium violaceum]